VGAAMRINAHARRGTISVMRAAVLLTAIVSMTDAADAQTTDMVTYYHTDAIGSVRMITDASGQVLERHDYLPFGQEWTAASSEHRLFVSKERDQETGLDYSGARYYSAQSGRFISPDPIAANEVRLLNPQRWNRYTYAANNPLTFGDPDGLDVIVFNFVNGAGGFGHIGIMAVDPNTGAGLYGGFNPKHANMPADLGRVQAQPFSNIRFQDGRPTHDALAEIEGKLVEAEGQGTRIRSLHFKTSASETARLRDFILRNQNDPAGYYVFGNNCLEFTIQGLRVAGINAPEPESLSRKLPNVYFGLTLSELEWRLARPTPRVETSYCFQTEKGCVP